METKTVLMTRPDALADLEKIGAMSTEEIIFDLQRLDEIKKRLAEIKKEIEAELIERLGDKKIVLGDLQYSVGRDIKTTFEQDTLKQLLPKRPELVEALPKTVEWKTTELEQMGLGKLIHRAVLSKIKVKAVNPNFLTKKTPAIQPD